MLDIAERIESHVLPIVQNLGLELWGIEINAGTKTVLRIYLENAGIDECAQVSRLLGLVLDIEECFADSWILEVSTPGLDRTFFNIEQLASYTGEILSVSLLEALSDEETGVKGRKKFQGKLLSSHDNTFLIFVEDTNKEVEIVWNLTKRVKMIPTFPEIEKPITKKSEKSKL